MVEKERRCLEEGVQYGAPGSFKLAAVVWKQGENLDLVPTQVWGGEDDLPRSQPVSIRS